MLQGSCALTHEGFEGPFLRCHEIMFTNIVKNYHKREVKS